MRYHPAVKIIIKLLEKNNYWFKAFEHAPVTTSEEVARLCPEYTLRQGAKAIIVKTVQKNGKDAFAMLVFPADLKFNGGKAKRTPGAKEVRFATEEEITEITKKSFNPKSQA